LTASDDLLLAECLRQSTQADLDICCFQEFRHLGKDNLSVPITIDNTTTTWDVFWSGYKRKRQAGVAIAIRSTKRIKVEEIGQISPRLIWVDCVVNGSKIRVVSAYAPTEESSDSRKKDVHLSNKENFYKTLRDNCVVEQKRQLLIGADMNATGDYGKSFVGGKSCEIGDVNDNSNRLFQFLNLKELALTNTWFEHKKKHKDTWYCNTGKFSKTIDYVMQSKWLMQFCSDCRVRTSFSFNNSDHRLLICRMRTPHRKIDRPRFIKKKKAYKYNCNALKDQYIHSNFVSKLDDLCSHIENPNIGVKDCTKLINIIEKAAKETIPDATKSVESYIWDQKFKQQS
jgi:exonuclease III